MKINEELLEKPDYGHYPICLGRLNAINAYCQRIFYYTAGACALMFVLTICTIRFSVISIIPNLIGDGTVVGANIVQMLILIGLILMAGFGVGKLKIFNLILFFIYTAMATVSVFTNYSWNFVSFFIGAIGAALSFKSLNVFLDYRQLSATEGFPFFSERLAKQEENSEYVPRYKSSVSEYTDKKMYEPENKIQPAKFTGRDLTPEMDTIEKMAEIPDIISSIDKIYIPQHKKYCTMSESPHRLSES